MPLDRANKERMRLAVAGGIAAQKLLAYIQALEDVDEHRGAIGREIFKLCWEADHLRSMQSLQAAEPLVLASHRAGRQEVDYHFFAVCCGRIERFLPKAAKAAGYKVPKADRDLLATYRPLRDYYEHMEDRLPGGSEYVEAESEEERNGTWHIKMGLTLDGQERIVLGGVTVDVTPHGVAAVRDVLKRNWEALKPSTLALVRKHFEVDPSDIPGTETLNRQLLVSACGG